MARTIMRWDGDPTSGLIEFDAVTLESPAHEVAITEYPVELGANLIDHVRPTPDILRIKGVVTNSPARLGLTQLDGAIALDKTPLRARQPFLSNGGTNLNAPQSLAGIPLERTVTVQAQVRTWSREGAQVRRVQNVYGLLVESMKGARQFTVSTDLFGDFDRMLIKSVSTQRTSKDGASLEFEFALRQITFAELVRRDISHLLAKKKPKAKASEPIKDEGKKEAPVADKQSDSHLYDIWGALAP